MTDPSAGRAGMVVLTVLVGGECGGMVAPAATATGVTAVATPARRPSPARSAPLVDRGDGSARASKTWIARRRWHERTRAVASCQILPVEDSSELVARVAVLERDGERLTRVSVTVLSDRTAGGEAAGQLSERNEYVVRGGLSGLIVSDTSGAGVPDPEAGRVRTLASFYIDWPGSIVAARLPAEGGEVGILADALRDRIDVRLRGETARDIVTSVRFSGVHEETWGRALAFYVEAHAQASDAAMCHRWTMRSDLRGGLVLRAADGAFVSLTLRGPRRDSQASCPDLLAVGTSAEPVACNEGEAALEVGCDNPR